MGTQIQLVSAHEFTDQLWLHLCRTHPLQYNLLAVDQLDLQRSTELREQERFVNVHN